MATSEILRRDNNGHIISKENKDYHICFKDNIDVIDIQSFKKYNRITEDEDYFDEDCYDETCSSTNAESFIDNYQKSNVEDCPNKDPKAFSKGGCNIL